MTYQKFLSVTAKVGSPDDSHPAPEKIPDGCKTSLLSSKYDVPELEDLGLDLKELGSNLFLGGETEALARLEIYMKKQVNILSVSSSENTYITLDFRIGFANLANLTQVQTAWNQVLLC